MREKGTDFSIARTRYAVNKQKFLQHPMVKRIRTSSAVDGRFSWVSKGVRVASGDLKMQHILKHLTEPTGERQHPFGTRLCLQSPVCYTLVPADAEKGL